MTALPPTPDHAAPDEAVMVSVRTRPVPPRPAPARWRKIAIGLSIAVHAAVLALLLLRPNEPGMLLTPDQAVEMVFEGATTAPTAGSAPAPNAPKTQPMADTPTVAEPGLSALEPTPTPTEPPSADATPPPPDPLPPIPEPASPILLPEPEVPAPAPRSVPIVRLGAPEEPTPEPVVPKFEPPAAPLPPRPLAPRPPAPAQRVPRPAPRARMADGFSPPINLDFSPAAPAALPRPRTGPGSRSVDLALGAPKAGPDRTEAFFDARARRVGADWASGLAAYWAAHKYYPRQAAENGEDGMVKVELVVNRTGKVESVEVIGKSGSPWLDMAALSTWRGAQLAPFPAENQDPRATMTLTINYILIR